jgi:hypothetical protein
VKARTAVSARDAHKRPIEKIAGSYAKPKLDWLVAVGRDSAAEYGLPLAIELAVTHLNNKSGKCNPGDEVLAANLGRSTKTIQRMRGVLVRTGHLRHDLNRAGAHLGHNADHVLLAPPSLDTRVSGDTPPLLDSFEAITGQIHPPSLDSQKCQVIDPASGFRPNQEEPDSENQMRKQQDAKAQTRYRETTGNPAAVQRIKASAVARKYGFPGGGAT